MQNSNSEPWNQYLEQCCNGSWISLFSSLPLVPRLITHKWMQTLGCPGRIDIWILKGVPSAFCASHWFCCMYSLENCKETWSVLQEEKKGAEQLQYCGFMQKFALTLSPRNWEPQSLVLSPFLWGTAWTFSPFKMLFLKHGHHTKMLWVYLRNSEKQVIEKATKVTGPSSHPAPASREERIRIFRTKFPLFFPSGQSFLWDACILLSILHGDVALSLMTVCSHLTKLLLKDALGGWKAVVEMFE